MELNMVADILQADFILKKDSGSINIDTACGADLMSDVLAFSRGKTMLLTGLTNPQVVRTAEITDIKVICFVRGKSPTEDTKKLAKEKEIVLLKSDKPLFECCGLLYEAGIKPEKLNNFKDGGIKFG
ncbi:MAG: hypothetical protein ACOCV3_00685 [Halanaerobiales bacterium]